MTVVDETAEVKGEELFQAVAPELRPPWEYLADIAPALGNQVKQALGDILARPALDMRTRTLATVALLAALGAAEPQLKLNVGAALRSGATPAEIAEVLTQVCLYAGFPRAINGVEAARAVFAERGLTTQNAPLAVVADFLDAAFGRGDLPHALTLLSEQVTWTVPGDREVAPWAGVWEGREGVTELFTVLGKVAAFDSLELGRRLPDGETVHVPARFALHYTDSGLPYAGEFVLSLTVRDGLVAAVRVHEDSWGMAQAYRGAAPAAEAA